MTKTVVHMIGQAHLDPVWLWPWTEGRAEALATSQSAVDRLDEYEDFHFIRGESQVYRWIEEENPALFERIRAYIDAGRWHVVNGMVMDTLSQGFFDVGVTALSQYVLINPIIKFSIQ